MSKINKKIKKNLTAEAAEYAEVEMAKCLAPGCRSKSGPLCHPSRKVKTAEEFSRNDLCALRPLFVHPLVFIPGGSKGKEESISIQGFLFFAFTKKKLCDLCVLCGSFFFILGGGRGFYSFLNNKKPAGTAAGRAGMKKQSRIFFSSGLQYSKQIGMMESENHLNIGILE